MNHHNNSNNSHGRLVATRHRKTEQQQSPATPLTTNTPPQPLPFIIQRGTSSPELLIGGLDLNPKFKHIFEGVFAHSG